MKNKIFLLAIITLVVLLNSSILYSQQHEEQSNHVADAHINKNHIALFNGATTVFEHDITSYTVGVEYEYRFTKTMGLGLLAEYITPEIDEFVLGITFFIHPFKGLKLMAAPILVYGEESKEEDILESEKEARFFGRIGIGYEIHVHYFTLNPIIDFDFGKTEAMGYGVGIGYGF